MQKEYSLDIKKLKILFISSEIEGFLKTGGLADVARGLSIALYNQGHDVRIIMPFYRTIEHRKSAKYCLSLALNTPYGLDDIHFKVHKMCLNSIPVYTIDNPYYFDRDGIYGEEHHAYHDNGERFAFFSVASLITTDALDFTPDIIHCNDWHTALIPYILATRYNNHCRFSNSKTVLTTHNACYQGIYQQSSLNILPEISSCMDSRVLQSEGYINYLKTGIIYSNKINTVSPNYAKELLTSLGSHGTSHQFLSRELDFEGILNGCDYKDWNPQTDKHIPANFTSQDLSGKAICKSGLQKKIGLAVSDAPVFGMVCRLTDQKGFGLLIPILERFLEHNVQLIIVGSGDASICHQLHNYAECFPNKFKFFDTYSTPLSHLIEAGADFFLMPSIFEPCGLNQLYSLAYGTLPIVRAVGGLKDTIDNYDDDPKNANGFVFCDADPLQLLNLLRRVILFYHEEPDEMKRLKIKAMRCHFYWSDSVKDYENLYYNALYRK